MNRIQGTGRAANKSLFCHLILSRMKQRYASLCRLDHIMYLKRKRFSSCTLDQCFNCLLETMCQFNTSVYNHNTSQDSHSEYFVIHTPNISFYSWLNISHPNVSFRHHEKKYKTVFQIRSHLNMLPIPFV